MKGCKYCKGNYGNARNTHPSGAFLEVETDGQILYFDEDGTPTRFLAEYCYKCGSPLTVEAVEQMNKESEYAELGKALEWAANNIKTWVYCGGKSKTNTTIRNIEELLKMYRESQKECN